MRYIAFLRGINVSGHKLIKMEELRKHFELPGFKNIVSYIQSGNILFDTKETTVAKLCDKIEKALESQLGYRVAVVLRTIDDIKRIIENNPYADISKDDRRKVHVTLLSAEPPAGLHKILESYKQDGEEFEITGTEIYLLLENYGNTKLSNTLIEKKAAVASTTRNWATLNKIVTL